MRPREIAAWTIAVVGFVAFLASATLECGQPVCSSFRAVAGGAWGDLVNHAAAISAVAAATALPECHFASQDSLVQFGKDGPGPLRTI